MKKRLISFEEFESPVLQNDTSLSFGDANLGFIENSQQIDSLLVDVDRGDSVANTIHAIDGCLAETNVPMSSSATAALNIAVEHLCASIGASRRQIPRVSPRRRMAQESMEGFKKFISNLLEKIKAAFMKLADYIKRAGAWLMGLFSSNKNKKEEIKKKETEFRKDVPPDVVKACKEAANAVDDILNMRPTDWVHDPKVSEINRKRWADEYAQWTAKNDAEEAARYEDRLKRSRAVYEREVRMRKQTLTNEEVDVEVDKLIAKHEIKASALAKEEPIDPARLFIKNKALRAAINRWHEISPDNVVASWKKHTEQTEAVIAGLLIACNNVVTIDVALFVNMINSMQDNTTSQYGDEDLGLTIQLRFLEDIEKAVSSFGTRGNALGMRVLIEDYNKAVKTKTELVAMMPPNDCYKIVMDYGLNIDVTFRTEEQRTIWGFVIAANKQPLTDTPDSERWVRLLPIDSCLFGSLETMKPTTVESASSKLNDAIQHTVRAFEGIGKVLEKVAMAGVGYSEEDNKRILQTWLDGSNRLRKAVMDRLGFINSLLTITVKHDADMLRLFLEWELQSLVEWAMIAKQKT